MTEDPQWQKVWRQLVSPFWTNPAGWEWRTDGHTLSLYNFQEQPGIWNLVWLSLDLDQPVDGYNIRHNSLAVWVMTSAHTTRCRGKTLEELAARHTLEQFAKLLPATVERMQHKPVEHLVYLAQRRLREKA